MTELSLFPEAQRDAVFSDCLTWRYRLIRRIGAGPRAALCMVNPSLAGKKNEDPTSTKVVGFGQRLGVGEWDVVNLAAAVAQDVRDLKAMADPVGPDNDRHIREAFEGASLHIVAWGVINKLPMHLRGRWRKVVAIAAELQVPLMCWGTNADGHPKHPLMLAYATPLVEWRPPR